MSRPFSFFRQRRRLFQNAGPIGIGLYGEARNILFPLLLNARVVIEIELAVYDLPKLGATGRRLSLRSGPSAIAAKLGGVGRRIDFELRRIRWRGELIKNALIGHLVRVDAL